MRAWARRAPFPQAETAAAAVPALRGQASCAATARAHVNETRGGDPKCLLHRERGLCTGGKGESGQGHPHFISFNQEIKLLSSFKLSIHGRGPLIQLRFLGEEKWGQVSGEAGTLAGAFPPIPCRRRLSPVTARAEPRPCTCPSASPRVSGVIAEEGPLPLTHQDLRHLPLLSFLFHGRGRDSRESCVWGPGLHRDPGDLS